MVLSIITKVYCAIEFVSVIKASRFITIEIENWFHADSINFISAIEASNEDYTHYTNDLLPHTPLQLYTYWRYG